MKKATYFHGIWCQNGIPFLAPYSAKTEPVLAPYSAKTELRFWHHMVPHGASWCQKVPKRDTQNYGLLSFRNLLQAQIFCYGTILKVTDFVTNYKFWQHCWVGNNYCDIEIISIFSLSF